MRRRVAMLAEVHLVQGQLPGRRHDLGFDVRSEATLRVLTGDMRKTIEIEGEKPNADSVRPSIARRLGVDFEALAPVDQHVDGMVDMCWMPRSSSAPP